jgi:hypothetical protein
MPFETELRTFNEQLPELAARAEGKYALIRGTEIADIYESRDAAIHAGYELFGSSPFLVKQCSYDRHNTYYPPPPPEEGEVERNPDSTQINLASVQIDG